MKKELFNGKRLKVARIYRGKTIDQVSKETNINKKDILAFEENKYDYKADIWSIGVITYFLFSGKLPFDYVSNNKKGKVDIIYNTLHDEIKFDNCERWKTISPEGICFIKELLNKDPEKRLNIKEVLEHKWIKKYYEDVIDRRKSSTNGSGYPNNIESVFKMYATINGDSKG